MKKEVDKNYCMSSFLTFRYIADEKKIFAKGLEHVYKNPPDKKEVIKCRSAKEIDYAIKAQLEQLDLSHAAILLSGGIDSGILASYMPEGTKAYTARCQAPNAVDETGRAKKICDRNGLEHIIVDITWKDYLDCMDGLMMHDGCPVFANEPQVYTLIKKIKEDGNDLVIFGDNADMAFGGMTGFLSKDWTYEEWIGRYTFLSPKQVLKNPVNVNQVYELYKITDSAVDINRFLSEVFAASSSGAYINSFHYAGIRYYDPYAVLGMADPLDLKRVRDGESKYLLRDLYKKKYPGFDVPEKIAMARAMEQWMGDWEGPKRDEFLPGCTKGLTGEQKFLVYSLERFLDLLDQRSEKRC